jgi:hypothetical protein
MPKLIPVEIIESKIYLIRGQKVMLDRDLAQLYNVSTRDLNKAVSRNLGHFPNDFMFSLNRKEFENLMFQNGTSRWGGTRKFPRVFTENGVAMLSSVLRSKRAIQVNIQIMRVFTKLRQILATHKELVFKLKELERKYERHDGEIQAIFEAIRQLMTPPETKKMKIGFVDHDE